MSTNQQILQLDHNRYYLISKHLNKLALNFAVIMLWLHIGFKLLFYFKVYIYLHTYTRQYKVAYVFQINTFTLCSLKSQFRDDTQSKFTLLSFCDFQFRYIFFDHENRHHKSLTPFIRRIIAIKQKHQKEILSERERGDLQRILWLLTDTFL